MYKHGKLTAGARKKLESKLERQNKKPRTSSSSASRPNSNQSKLAASKNNTKNKKQSSTPNKISTTTTNIAAKSSSNSKKVVKNNKQSSPKERELTMADVCDTPPRQKLVNARKSAMEENADVNWISLINFNQKEAENEEHVYSKLELQSNARFRQALDGQMKIKSKQARISQVEKKRHQDSLNEKYGEYAAVENSKHKVKQSKTLELKQIRESQVADANRRRKYQELKLQKYELREVTKLKKALAQEKLDKQNKKLANMNKLQDMLRDNEQQKELKAKQQKRLDLEEIRLQGEYAKMLELQEQKREQALRDIQAKQERKLQALIAATADIHLKAEQDAKRAKIEQLKREKMQDQKEFAKKERLRLDMESCKSTIAEQINEKERRIRAEIEQDREYGQRMKKLALEFEVEKQKIQAGKLEKQVEQARYLEQQISRNEKRREDAKTEMSQSEKMLNKKLLDNVRNSNANANNANANSDQLNPQNADQEIDQNAPFAWRYSYRKAPF